MITGVHIVNDQERELISLPPKLGDLGIKILSEIAEQEFENLSSMAVSLVSILA